MNFEQVAQLIAIGFMILGATWRLSSQISSLAAKLQAHIERDDERFREVDATLDLIAPRAVRLVKGGR